MNVRRVPSGYWHMKAYMGCLFWKTRLLVSWTAHPVIVTIGDTRDHIRVLLYSYYTAITGWGVLLSY